MLGEANEAGEENEEIEEKEEYTPPPPKFALTAIVLILLGSLSYIITISIMFTVGQYSSVLEERRFGWPYANALIILTFLFAAFGVILGVSTVRDKYKNMLLIIVGLVLPVIIGLFLYSEYRNRVETVDWMGTGKATGDDFNVIFLMIVLLGCPVVLIVWAPVKKIRELSDDGRTKIVGDALGPFLALGTCFLFLIPASLVPLYIFTSLGTGNNVAVYLVVMGAGWMVIQALLLAHVSVFEFDLKDKHNLIVAGQLVVCFVAVALYSWYYAWNHSYSTDPLYWSKIASLAVTVMLMIGFIVFYVPFGGWRTSTRSKYAYGLFFGVTVPIACGLVGIGNSSYVSSWLSKLGSSAGPVYYLVSTGVLLTKH
jgi:hypothetical protein